MTRALLALEDGTVFWGESIGAMGEAVGEVVFNTAMTGYQEILTDPSYFKQLVTLTYPHIGNTGINEDDAESDRIMAQGLILKEKPRRPSNFRSTQSLSEYLSAQQVVGIAEIDTRMLTRILRDNGAQAGVIIASDSISAEAAIAKARQFGGLKGLDLAKEVTTAKPYRWTQGSWSFEQGYPDMSAAKYHIAAFDYGIKRNILRMLADRGCVITVFPAQTPVEAVLAINPDGIFLSNGPGDPEPCDYAIHTIQQLLKAAIPIFGICLGHQLLALASGARTIKMKFGHHGSNHPVQEIHSGRVLITAQNHGFTVDEQTLPPHLKATHYSLFDGSIQGLRRTDRPAFSFQGHPEASPGPHDIAHLFDQFIAEIQAYRTQVSRLDTYNNNRSS